MSHHTVQEFYGKAQPCVIVDCGKTNEFDDGYGKLKRYFRHPDMAPLCKEHRSQHEEYLRVQGSQWS